MLSFLFLFPQQHYAGASKYLVSSLNTGPSSKWAWGLDTVQVTFCGPELAANTHTVSLRAGNILFPYLFSGFIHFNVFILFSLSRGIAAWTYLVSFVTSLMHSSPLFSWNICTLFICGSCWTSIPINSNQEPVMILYFLLQTSVLLRMWFLIVMWCLLFTHSRTNVRLIFQLKSVKFALMKLLSMNLVSYLKRRDHIIINLVIGS